jgi:hypothetical protein
MPDIVVETEPAWEVKLKWVRHTIELDEAQKARRRKAKAEKAAAGGEQKVDAGAQDDGKLTVWSLFVDFFRKDGTQVRFRVNYLNNGCVTFSDSRDRVAGPAAMTGIWGTLPPVRAPRPRTITPTAFRVEASRFIGQRRAKELVDALMKG